MNIHFVVVMLLAVCNPEIRPLDCVVHENDEVRALLFESRDAAERHLRHEYFPGPLMMLDLDSGSQATYHQVLASSVPLCEDEDSLETFSLEMGTGPGLSVDEMNKRADLMLQHWRETHRGEECQR